MELLTRIIGPAPSELSDELLYDRLSIERLRVQASLQIFKDTPTNAKVSKPKAKKAISGTALATEALELCKQLNMTIDDFIKFVKENEE